MAVRNTWGSDILRKKMNNIRMAFFFGDPSARRSKVRDRLAAIAHRESRNFGDCIQSRVEDSQETLSLKGLAMLDWITTFCPQACHTKSYVKNQLKI